MATRSNTSKPMASKAQTPSTMKNDETVAPANVEVKKTVEAAEVAAEPTEKVVVETSVMKKLGKKTDNDSLFVPTNPAELEKAASQVAQENGFELNRGTSIGARLIAKSRNMA
jgi:hypothetical protein